MHPLYRLVLREGIAHIMQLVLIYGLILFGVWLGFDYLQEHPDMIVIFQEKKTEEEKEDV